MKFGRLGVAVVVTGLLAGNVGGAVAQDETGPTDYRAWNTKEVAPGVLRVLDDAAGHESALKSRSNQGRPSHIAVGPDGDVWLSVMVTVTRDDKARHESRLWRLGQEKTYGRADGLSDQHYSMAFDGEGRLWVFGDRITTLDDGEWSSTKGSNSVAAPDGTVWVSASEFGVEQWDGTELIPHLEDTWTGRVFVGPDGTVGVDSWDGVRLFDGSDWKLAAPRQNMRVLTPTGILAVLSDNRKGIRLYGDGQATSVLDSVRVNSMSAAPDGSIWVAGSVGRNRMAVYRVDPSDVFAAAVADEATAEDASST